MENFVVSARKYRPQGFEEVVGQEHITTTITNAIQNNLEIETLHQYLKIHRNFLETSYNL